MGETTVERALGRIEGQVGELKEQLTGLRDEVRENRGAAEREHGTLSARMGRVEVALGIQQGEAGAEARAEQRGHMWRQIAVNFVSPLLAAVLGAAATLMTVHHG